MANWEGALIGYTVGNDVSSRSIEGANPLYLPQAKFYERSCAIGPGIALANSVSPPFNIRIRISRRDEVVFEQKSSTSTLKRSFDDQLAWLFSGLHFPKGVFLMTGTPIVPPATFTLEPGDQVAIGIDGLGAIWRTPCDRLACVLLRWRGATLWTRLASSRPKSRDGDREYPPAWLRTREWPGRAHFSIDRLSACRYERARRRVSTYPVRRVEEVSTTEQLLDRRGGADVCVRGSAATEPGSLRACRLRSRAGSRAIGCRSRRPCRANARARWIARQRCCTRVAETGSARPTGANT